MIKEKYEKLSLESKLAWRKWEGANDNIHSFESFLLVEEIADENGIIQPEKWAYFFDVYRDTGYTHLKFQQFARYNKKKAIEMFSLIIDDEDLQQAKKELSEEIDEGRNSTWINNHSKISGALNDHMKQYLSFPTVSSLAKQTGLSRTTVNKHFKQLTTNEYYESSRNMLRMAAENLTSNLYAWALNGNMKAANLFLQYVAQAEKVNHQNRKLEFQKQSLLQQPKTSTNYIQINNTKIDVNTIESLPKEKQLLISQILTGETPSLEAPKEPKNAKL